MHRRFVAAAAAFAVAVGGFVRAAEPPAGNPPESGAIQAAAAAGSGAVKSADDLALEQRRIAEKFRRFEQVIKLLAQFSDEGGEEQSRLLRQVFAESQSRAIDGKFEELVKLLKSNQLGRASADQEQLAGQLEELLAMLLAAERGKELKEEQARLKDYVKRIKELITKQMEVQGRTAQGDPKSVAPEQGKLAENAADLAGRMARAADAQKQDAAGKPQDGRPGDDKSGEKTPGDKKSPGDKQAGEPSKPGEKQSPSQKGEPSEGQSGKPSDKPVPQGAPGQSQPGRQGEQSGESSKTESPQRRVEAAQRRMAEARKKLEQAQREGAMRDQDDAIRELEQAKAELEEILRQLREEELARLLDMLEKRFAEMLRMQEAVYRDTQGLHAVPLASRGKAEQIESGRLSREEGVILVAVDKALNVLKEEGTAVAFPKTVEQMRDDVAQIVELLAATKVDELTLSIEEDVIATLKEMIEALQKAKQDLKDKQQQQRPSEGQAGEQPLIDKIAELKMIRALQMRVNRRTKLISETVDVAADAQALEMLRKLAATEQEVFQITRDIVLGKNK